MLFSISRGFESYGRDITVFYWQKKALLPIITGVLISFCEGGKPFVGLFDNRNPSPQWRRQINWINATACRKSFPCILNVNECWLIVACVTQSGSNKYTPAGKDKRPLEFCSNQSQIRDIFSYIQQQINKYFRAVLFVFCVCLGSLCKKKKCLNWWFFCHAAAYTFLLFFLRNLTIRIICQTGEVKHSF